MPTLPVVLKLENILVATDFSPASQLATRFAIEIARRHNAKLLMTHVAASQSEKPLMDAWRAGQSEIMDHFIAGRLTGIPHELLVKPGEVWEVLSELIAERSIDLVVVGTRGRTGVWKLIMGSVAERIFRQAPCPVLIVGPSSSQNPEDGAPRILVPTGFAHQSLYAVRYAVWLAEQLRSSLAVLHVVTDAERLAPEEKERIGNERLKRLRALIPEDAKLRAPAGRAAAWPATAPPARPPRRGTRYRRRPPPASLSSARRRPVNDPFSCPNSSLSSRVSVMAAQLMATNGLLARPLLAWMARATSSLPVPLSPQTSTVDSRPATLEMNSRTPRMAWLSPIMP